MRTRTRARALIDLSIDSAEGRGGRGGDGVDGAEEGEREGEDEKARYCRGLRSPIRA